MTKKDFIALADLVRAARPKFGTGDPDDKFGQGLRAAWEDMRGKLADFCAASNPRFNRSRWLDYIDGICGPSGGKVKN